MFEIYPNFTAIRKKIKKFSRCVVVFTNKIRVMHRNPIFFEIETGEKNEQQPL